MTFFDFQEKDILSVEYTAYPTRSLSLRQVNANELSTDVFLYLSGNLAIGTNRTYFDTNGAALTQSFYSKSKVYVRMDGGLTGTNAYMKRSVNRLRNIYASSSFYKPQNFDTASVYLSPTQVCSIINISTLHIGSGIKPGSFRVTSGSTVIAQDDGYGGLYSASVLRGCVFYEYGIGYLSGSPFAGMAGCQVNFSATHHIPMNVYICNAPKGMLNFSINPSYTQLSGNKQEITTDDPKTFISTIVLYDENFEAVGVAKVATPNLKEETDGLQYRLKLNF